VSEHTAYHHGEASLNSTIISMALNFVGSNNVNLLKPVGQFGSRLMGGKDAASPHYIHTYLGEIVSKIFCKEDAELLKYINDDGDLVEREYYLPVVPLLAINGSWALVQAIRRTFLRTNPMTWCACCVIA
jgi:DNA topoisomerase-2